MPDGLPPKVDANRVHLDLNPPRGDGEAVVRRAVELGANTHPQVVRAVVEECLAAGAKKVKVFDNTCNDARRCYANSGIEAAIKGLNKVECKHIEQERFRKVALNGQFLNEWELYDEALSADVYINLPVGALAAAASWWLLHKRESKRVKVPVDIVGLLLLVIGVGSLQFMLDNGNEMDWFDSPEIVASACISVVALSFMVHEPSGIIVRSSARSLSDRRRM